MKFTAVLFALMASTALAAPHQLNADPKDLAKGLAGPKDDPAGAAAQAGVAGAGAGKAAAKAGKNSGSSKNSSGSDSNNSTSSSSSSSSVDNSSSNNGTSSNDSSSNNATQTSSAASATRTRECDQGDQSLAAGLNAAVVIGIGQQASVVTLQNISSQSDFVASDFNDGVTRLQQFTDTMALQLQMAQGIADDDSFAQTQLKLLADSQTSQQDLVKSLGNVTSAADAQNAADTLTQLLQSFLDSTNNAQDGAVQALIDCSLPLTAISG